MNAPLTPEEPITPGWYAYSGGAQTMLFHLRETGQWSAHFDNGSSGDCDWGYIEQALSVFGLVRVQPNAVEDLTEAIRLTVEYVGTETLRPIEGWSWYDALHKYAPEKVSPFVEQTDLTVASDDVAAAVAARDAVWVARIEARFVSRPEVERALRAADAQDDTEAEWDGEA